MFRDFFGYMSAMAETLDDLLAPRLMHDGVGLTAWCQAHGLQPRTVYRLRSGVGTRGPNLGTLALLAHALGTDVARVRAAIEASRHPGNPE